MINRNMHGSVTVQLREIWYLEKYHTRNRRERGRRPPYVCSKTAFPTKNTNRLSLVRSSKFHPRSGHSIMVCRERERRLGRSRVVRRRDFDQGLRPLLGRDPFLIHPDDDGERPAHVARGRRLHGTERQQHRILHDRLRGHVVQHGRVDLAPGEINLIVFPLLRVHGFVLHPRV